MISCGLTNLRQARRDLVVAAQMNHHLLNTGTDIESCFEVSETLGSNNLEHSVASCLGASQMLSRDTPASALPERIRCPWNTVPCWDRCRRACNDRQTLQGHLPTLPHHTPD